MILQALYDYYKRVSSDPERHIAPEGFEWKEIPFVIVIDREGNFINLEDTSEIVDNKRRFKRYLVPKDRHTTGPNAWEIPNLFWDHYGFVLGYPKDNVIKSKEMALRQKKSFVNLVSLALKKYQNSQVIRAISLFYERGNWRDVFLHQNWPVCAKRHGCNLTFKIEGVGLAIDAEAIRKLVTSLKEDEPNVSIQKDAICLLTGEKGSIAIKHTPTPIFGSRSNAKIVSFQKNSGYDSYGKIQGKNAPVSKKAEFAYTTAIKILKSSLFNNIFIGNDTILFWSEKKHEKGAYDLENDFSYFFADPPKDNPEGGIQAVRALYAACQSGRMPKDEGDRFYVLGLSPNAARIAVRFWKTGTISDFAQKIKMHFDDLEIIKSRDDPEYLPLNRLLRSTALEYKTDNIPPNLAGAVMESVLNGTPYPVTLLQQCIRRIRAERHVTRSRAAILKACLNRFNRLYKNKGKEDITVSLDKNNRSQGYRLGRLFAVLEKIQEEANPGINATIRDRFYGAASSSPVTVFPQLLRLKNHHLAKIENPGRKINFEKQLGDIFAGIEDFPSHLIMQEQARFAVGYYHQRQSFFERGIEKSE